MATSEEADFTAPSSSRTESGRTEAAPNLAVPPESSQAGTPRIAWAAALPKAAIAGFVTVLALVIVLGITRLPVLIILIVPAGGAFAVWLYARGKNTAGIVPGMGARLGAVMGIFAFAIYGLFVAAQLTATRGNGMEDIRKGIQEAIAKNPNPQGQALMNQMLTPDGMVTLLALSAVIFLFMFLIFGAIGGSAAAAMLRNRRYRAP